MKGRECKLEHKAKEKKSQRSEIITYLSLMLVSLFLDVRDLLTFFSARMQGLKNMSEQVSHWKKLDHVAFLLMLPLLCFMLLISMVSSEIANPYLILTCLLLWSIAFFYDLTEKKEAKTK